MDYRLIKAEYFFVFRLAPLSGIAPSKSLNVSILRPNSAGPKQTE